MLSVFENGWVASSASSIGHQRPFVAVADASCWITLHLPVVVAAGVVGVFGPAVVDQVPLVNVVGLPSGTSYHVYVRFTGGRWLNNRKWPRIWRPSRGREKLSAIRSS
jgi:hypothetical protein